MIFQHTWKQVISGEKTQTRRIVKPTHRITTPLATEVIGKHSGRVIQTAPSSAHGLLGNHHVTVWSVWSGKRAQWEVGKTYAVQSYRNKPAVLIRPTDGVGVEPVTYTYDLEYEQSLRYDGRSWMRDMGYREARIRITGIRREDVRHISEVDVKAEGFEFRLQFLQTWTQMHDKPAYQVCMNDDLSDGDESGSVSHWSAWVSWLHSRPAERYAAWVLTFELVKE